ncbi:MAG: hypothetical protein WBL02_06135 [Methanomethylovorans sp.]|uniref:hypothetical protein n=1 Tax=Methanomethylovorans sp. TaxID=2758717 RepID=UPI000AB46EE2|nr:hypothetical protein [Methanomethylovorans sp.]
MRPERKMVLCENGNIVMRQIVLSYRKDNGEEIFLLDAEAVVEERPNYRIADELYRRMEENFINIGLLKRVDMTFMSDDMVRELILKKHEKEERFLNAGAERGFKLADDIDPDDILRFYASLTPEERTRLSCNP